MKLTKLFVGAFALSAMLVACGDDCTSAKDTEIEELSSSSAVEIASSSSTIRNDSLSSSAIESSSSSAVEIASSSSTIRNDSLSSSAIESSSSSAVEIASSSSTIRNDSLSSSAIESSSSSAVEITSSSSTIRNDNFSSSSAMESSSSSETTQSSSSITTATPCNVDGENNCVYGTLTDTRDGKTYKTVTIGDQTWMAENLNYAYTGVRYSYRGWGSDSTSWCYDNDPANCAKYGRLYTWAAAMDSVGTWSTNGKGCGEDSTCSPTGTIRGICPEGWHLPDTTEWKTLFTAVGGQDDAGVKLKAQTGWYDSGNGTDSFGFSALPAGYKYYDVRYFNEGNYAYFWSSTEFNSVCAYYNDSATRGSSSKGYGFSVRCLKD